MGALLAFLRPRPPTPAANARRIHIQRFYDTPMKSRILLATLPLAVLFAACDDPSGPGETADANRVAIFYSGGVAGSFAAEGEYVTGPAPNTQTFAQAVRRPDGTLELSAYSQRGGARFDIASITLPNAAVGQRAVEHCPGETCSSVSLGLDVGQVHGSQAAQSCQLQTGTIRVTALSATRVTGTVSGSGFCLPRDGGDSVPFQITAGTFDVDVLQQ